MTKRVVPTPITDLVEKLLSADTPLKLVLEAARAAERAGAEIARSSAAEAATLKRRREADRERKAAERLRPKDSSADKQSPLFLPSEIDSLNLDSQKKNSSAATASADKRKVAPHRLPDDWMPKMKHYEMWSALAAQHCFAFERGAVDGYAAEMREWTAANAHRSITRKCDWDATFSGWLRRAAPQHRRNNGRGPNGSRGGPNGGRGGPSMGDIARGDFT